MNAAESKIPHWIIYTWVGTVPLLIGVFFVVVNFTDRPPHEERARWERLAYEEGRLDSYEGAWQAGRDQGYRELETFSEYETLGVQAEVYKEGWFQGYEAGRNRYEVHRGY